MMTFIFQVNHKSSINGSIDKVELNRHMATSGPSGIIEYIKIKIFSNENVIIVCTKYLPVAYSAMEANNELLLLRCKPPSSNIRSQVVYPSQTTTLPASLKP